MMASFSQKQIQELDRRFRSRMINSLAGYKQPVLVGTRSAEGTPNLALFNSLIHIGANPAMYGLLFRPATVRRDTLSNILNTGVYTLNYPSSDLLMQAHQTSAKYPAERSEFDATGLTEERIEPCLAPFVKESPVKIAMHLKEKLEVQSNGTTLLIGGITFIHLGEDILKNDGFIALHDARILACSGLDAYYEPHLMSRLSYAQPDKPVTSLG